MGNPRMDPKQQFSKKLARWTSIFWFIYMAWLSALLLLAPASAQYAVYMGIIATVVMMINVVSYTANSVQEKILLAMIDRTQIELSLKNNKADTSATDGPEDEPPEEGGADEECG